MKIVSTEEIERMYWKEHIIPSAYADSENREIAIHHIDPPEIAENIITHETLHIVLDDIAFEENASYMLDVFTDCGLKNNFIMGLQIEYPRDASRHKWKPNHIVWIRMRDETIKKVIVYDREFE